MSEPLKSAYRLVGLQLRKLDDTTGGDWIDYDLGVIAYNALEALKVAVLAVEQVVTGEVLVHSKDLGDFYHNLENALVVENGMGINSEPGDVAGLQTEIQDLIDLVFAARLVKEEVSTEPSAETEP